MEIYTRNERALEALSHGDFLQAQMLFRQNAQDIPSCFTLNNLGMFYLEFGIQQKSGRIRNANHLGLQYLLQAARMTADSVNQANLGQAYMKENLLNEAYASFSHAFLLKKLNEYAYNMGVCLFIQQKYKMADACFFPLCQEGAVDEENCIPPLLVLAFCRIFASNQNGCLVLVEEYRRRHPHLNANVVFLLRFLLRDYYAALTEWKEMRAEWYPDEQTCAILADCLLHVSVADAERISIEQWCNCFKPNKYNSTKKVDVNTAKNLFVPYPIKLCGYYGCKAHETSYPPI